jgi:hypothetical protein
MAFKLIECAQSRWRAVNAPHLLALVRAGARFEAGKSRWNSGDEVNFYVNLAILPATCWEYLPARIGKAPRDAEGAPRPVAP